jgi:hypothetical protein
MGRLLGVLGPLDHFRLAGRMASIAERFGSRIVIWGGIPSTLLEDHVSDAAFRRQLRMVRQTVRPDRLIVGLAEQAMPESRYDRLVELGKRPAKPPLTLARRFWRPVRLGLWRSHRVAASSDAAGTGRSVGLRRRCRNLQPHRQM